MENVIVTRLRKKKRKPHGRYIVISTVIYIILIRYIYEQVITTIFLVDILKTRLSLKSGVFLHVNVMQFDSRSNVFSCCRWRVRFKYYGGV